MSAIRGTIRDGKVILDTPADWPDGKRVLVVDSGADNDELVMLTDEAQGTDPESIAHWIAWADSLQPLVMTPEEVAEWEKARAEHKAWEFANWESKKIEDLFR